jgi:hypothetical protein
MPGVFIDDGYTLTFYWPPRKNGEASDDEVEFVYRPLSRSERVVHGNRVMAVESRRAKAVADGKPDEAAKVADEQCALACAAMSKKLVSWGVTSSKGEPVEIKPDTVAKLRPDVFEALWEAMNSEGDEKN